jgi:hypothetical protein
MTLPSWFVRKTVFLGFSPLRFGLMVLMVAWLLLKADFDKEGSKLFFESEFFSNFISFSYSSFFTTLPVKVFTSP